MHQYRRTLCWLGSVIVCLGYATTLFLTACSTSPQLSVLFEPIVHKPLERRPRRPPYERPKPPPMVEVLPEAPQTDWKALLEQLPKDDSGSTDWMRSFEEKLITLKSTLDDKPSTQEVLEVDVELIPKGAPDSKAIFSHKSHTTLLACGSCHTDIFQMEAGADPITMDKIFAGQYCGRCHGKVAFDPAASCGRCHPKM